MFSKHVIICVEINSFYKAEMNEIESLFYKQNHNILSKYMKALVYDKTFVIVLSTER